MTGSFNSGDLLGGGLGRAALAVCILVAIALLVPIGLASVGFGAILGVAAVSERLPLQGSLASPRLVRRSR